MIDTSSWNGWLIYADYLADHGQVVFESVVRSKEIRPDIEM